MCFDVILATCPRADLFLGDLNGWVELFDSNQMVSSQTFKTPQGMADENPVDMGFLDEDDAQFC